MVRVTEPCKIQTCVRRIAFSWILWLISIHAGFTQWIQTDGPYAGANVKVILQSDSLLFSATACGYFSKKAIPEHWTLHSTMTFVSHTVIGDSLFAGTLNNGINLISMSDPGFPPVSISRLTADTLSHSDSCLYAGTRQHGFFKSGNFGLSWDPCNNGLPVDTIWDSWGGGVSYMTYVSCIEVIQNHIYYGTEK